MSKNFKTITFTRNGGDVGGPFVWLKRFIRFLKTKDVKILNVRTSPADVLCVVAGKTITIDRVKEFKKEGSKVIVRVGGIYLPFQCRANRNHADAMKVTKQIIKLSDYAFYNSIFGKQLMDKYYCICPEKKSCIIPNGVDLEFFNPKRAHSRWLKKIGEADLIVGSIAHWRELPRTKQFLKAVRPTIEKIPKTKFVLAGKKTPIVRDTIRSFVKQNKLQDYVVSIGHITQETASMLWPCFDIFLHTRWNDCGPNSIVEALASGVPVVTNNFSAGKELAKDAGVVYNFCNDPYEEVGHVEPEEIADKIKTVYDDLKVFKKRARKVAENNYDAEKLFQKYYEKIKSC